MYRTRTHLTALLVTFSLAAAPAGAVDRTWDPITGSLIWSNPVNWNPTGTPGTTDNAFLANGNFAALSEPVVVNGIEVSDGTFLTTGSHDITANEFVRIMGSNSVIGMGNSNLTAPLLEIGSGGKLEMLGGTIDDTQIHLGLNGTGRIIASGSITTGGSNSLVVGSSGVIAARQNGTLVLASADLFGGGSAGGTIEALLGDVEIHSFRGEDSNRITMEVGANRTLGFRRRWDTVATDRYLLNGGDDVATLDPDSDFFNNGVIEVQSGVGRITGTIVNQDEGQLRVEPNTALEIATDTSVVNFAGGQLSLSGNSLVTGGPILNHGGVSGNGGRLANQRLDNYNRVYSSNDGEFVIDTLEPFDFDGPNDNGVLDAFGGDIRVTERAAPALTVFRSTMSILLDSRFTMEAGDMVLASEGTIDFDNGLNEFVGNSLIVAGSLNVGVQSSGSNSTGIINANLSLNNGSTTTVDASGDRLILNGDSTLVAGATIAGSGKLVIGESGSLEVDTGYVIPLDVINDGTLSPGRDIGKLELAGDFTQSATGEFIVDLAGTSSDQFDTLAVSEIAALNGTISANLLNGFTPQVGDSFSVLTAPVVAGSFDNQVIPLSSGLALDVIQSVDSVMLEVIQAILSGDYDGNGLVGAGDLDLVLGAWGEDVGVTGVPAGWINEVPTALIGAAQLDVVLSNWGASSAASFATVPEPSASLMLLCGLICVMRAKAVGRIKRPRA